MPIGVHRAVLISSSGTESLENLLLWSEAFSTSPWVSTGLNNPVITGNTAIAPDGNSTADTAEDDWNAAYEEVKQDSSSFTASETYTLSLFVKKDATGRATRFPSLMLQFDGSVTEQNELSIDTSTGDSSFSGTDPSATSGVDSYDSNYWRAWITAKSQSGANNTMTMRLFPARGASSVWAQNAASQGFVVIWGAQINTGSLKDYVKTESTAV